MRIRYGSHTIDGTDVKSIESVLKNDFLTQGKHVKKFENALKIKFGSKYCSVLSKKNLDNLTILNKSYFNADLLKNLNKNTILISHHSNVFLEGIYMGFKCISSSATFWDVKKLCLANTWSNKYEYKKILNKSWKQLKYSNNNDFNSLVKDYFYNDYNLLGKKYYITNILSEFKFGKNFNYNLKKLHHECSKLKMDKKKKINKKNIKKYI